MKRALVVFTVALLPAFAGPAPSGASRLTVTVLETSDLHGHLTSWQDSWNRQAPIGLARVASRVKAIRAGQPNVLLLDGGDTIQGSALEYLHARHDRYADLLRQAGVTDGRDPMMIAMNTLGYAAMAVGNHEFDYGLDVLKRARSDAAFPWLSANTRNAADGSAAFPEYVVKDVGGVRIGVLGLTTPAIPEWEPEVNREGLRWEDPVAAARRLVPVLRGHERCDFVIVLVHSGPEIDLLTGKPDGTDSENRVAALAREVPGIDLLLTGHTHREIPLTRIGGVPIIQPGRWGETLARVDVTFERRDGSFRVVGMDGRLLPSDESVPDDAEIARLAAPPERAAQAYLSHVVGRAGGPFPAEGARLGDSALLDFVNDVQLEETGADLSMTSLLPGDRYEGLAAGPLTVRDLWALYPYDNFLEVVEIDGAGVKALLEHAAEYYASAAFRDGHLVLTPKPGMIGYNFDVLEGVTYRIDPTAPAGSRIRDLTFRGRAVRPEETFTLAVNSYRARGAGGYSALKGARVLRTIPREIRELLIERVRKAGVLQPVLDHNWSVAPDVVFSPAPATDRR